jgi:hypothetical protein
MTNRRTLPWWLAGGTDLCDLCEQSHAPQSLRRCAACDRPGCEHCVTVDRGTGEILCHDCAAEAKEGR